MRDKKPILDTEAFVRKVLTETFGQKADADTVRAVAEKVSQVVADSAPKKASAPKEKAA